MKTRKIYIVCYQHISGYTSVPMTVFSNKKSAEEFVIYKNNTDGIEKRWFYYDEPLEKSFWWKD